MIIRDAAAIDGTFVKRTWFSVALGLIILRMLLAWSISEASESLRNILSHLLTTGKRASVDRNNGHSFTSISRSGLDSFGNSQLDSVALCQASHLARSHSMIGEAHAYWPVTNRPISQGKRLSI